MERVGTLKFECGLCGSPAYLSRVSVPVYKRPGEARAFSLCVNCCRIAGGAVAGWERKLGASVGRGLLPETEPRERGQ